MVNLGVNLVAGTRVPLGIVPSGTGNDMARGLGIPHDDTEAAIRMLGDALGRPARVIDAVRIEWTDADGSRGERRFACALSAGFDAAVNERANLMRRPKGASRYVIALLAELARLRPVRYRLELDGQVVEQDALMVSAGNNVSLGGGMKITPDALLDDGLLDVMIVDPMSRTKFLRLFPKVFQGTHTTLPVVAMRRARRIRIESGAPIVVYADGERIAPLPVDVEVESGALRVLA